MYNIYYIEKPTRVSANLTAHAASRVGRATGIDHEQRPRTRVLRHPQELEHAEPVVGPVA